MMTLIAAAIAAAQPAPQADPHAMPMHREQHEAAKEKCCCDDMAKHDHDGHAAEMQPDDHRGE